MRVHWREKSACTHDIPYKLIINPRLHTFIHKNTDAHPQEARGERGARQGPPKVLPRHVRGGGPAHQLRPGACGDFSGFLLRVGPISNGSMRIIMNAYIRYTGQGRPPGEPRLRQLGLLRLHEQRGAVLIKVNDIDD